MCTSFLQCLIVFYVNWLDGPPHVWFTNAFFPDMQIPIDTPLTNGIGIWPTMSMIRLHIFVGNCLEFLGISHCIQIYPNMCWLNPGFAWLNPHYFPYKMPVPAMLQSVLTRGPCPDLHRDLALWFGRARLSHRRLDSNVEKPWVSLRKWSPNGWVVHFEHQFFSQIYILIWNCGRVYPWGNLGWLHLVLKGALLFRYAVDGEWRGYTVTG